MGIFKKIKSVLQLENRILKFDKSEVGNVKGLNILIFTENVNATYYISFDFPLSRMHAEGENNFFVVSQNLVGKLGQNCWSKMYRKVRPDIVIMSRYAVPYGIEILNFFKEKKVPVIYHIDDDLLDVPDSLGAEIVKRQNLAVKDRVYLLKNVSMVYASTDKLREKLQSRFPQQKIINGDIYASFHAGIATNRQFNSIKVIGYMGSKGHVNDLALVIPALERLMDENKELRFEVFGSIQIPDRLKRFGDRVSRLTDQRSYADFLKTLGTLNWDIGMAPLVNGEFNMCKAPTKYIEYTSAGIPIIASNFSVYSDVIPEGGGILSDDCHWYESLSSVIKNPRIAEEMLAVSTKHCSAKFSPNTLDVQLRKILMSI